MDLSSGASSRATCAAFEEGISKLVWDFAIGNGANSKVRLLSLLNIDAIRRNIGSNKWQSKYCGYHIDTIIHQGDISFNSVLYKRLAAPMSGRIVRQWTPHLDNQNRSAPSTKPVSIAHTINHKGVDPISDFPGFEEKSERRVLLRAWMKEGMSSFIQRVNRYESTYIYQRRERAEDEVEVVSADIWIISRAAEIGCYINFIEVHAKCVASAILTWLKGDELDLLGADFVENCMWVILCIHNEFSKVEDNVWNGTISPSEHNASSRHHEYPSKHACWLLLGAL
ncbi:hypothetical protein BDN71DRAFT_1428299 [Pleurotus eryngii]|uniref:Uncharacterized protein n=1 Tax=Pleurotus eryngii TaxID=5323 RepID=A0A9P6DJF7_PLEER|nr:hypothetical protein BDN71DRAFT_1428299 [Pleurotus eryngii]